MKRSRLGALAMVLVFSRIPWLTAGDWLHFGADGVYSGHSRDELRLNASSVGELERAWGIGCDDSWFSVISASPAIRDGVLYTSGAGSRLTAYEARTGRMLWDFGQGNYGWAPQPVAASDGTIIYMEGSYPTEVFAVDGATGSELWQAPLGFDLSYTDTALATVDDTRGLVYVVETPFEPGAGKIYALNLADGEVAWWMGQATHQLGFKGDFLLLHDGLIYAVAVDEDEHSWRFEKVTAIDPDTREIAAVFTAPTDVELREISRISICGDRLLVNFCDRDDVFEGEGAVVAYALDSGSEQWRFASDGPITGHLACNEARGTVYVPAGPYLRALDLSDGAELWNHLGFSDIYSPSLANGVLYYLSDTNMYAVDESDGSGLFRYGLGEQAYEATQVAIADGMTFFSGNGGTCDLYALHLPGNNPTAVIDGFIPAAARNAGASGTFWGTSLWAFQDRADVATLSLRAGNAEHPAAAAEARQLSVMRGQVLRVDDVLALFPEVAPPAAVFYSWQGVDPDQAVVTSRTFTAAPGGAPGTLGQGIQGIDLTTLPPADASQVVPLSPDNDTVRCNLGVVNAAEQSTGFVMRLRDQYGTLLGELEFSLPGASWRQFNGVFSSVGIAPVDLAYAEVAATGASVQNGTARFAIYSSLVDNLSGDPTYLAGQWAGDFGEVLIPVAAHNPGANGTQWVSDISTINWQGQDQAVCSYTFLAEGQANYPSPAGSRSFALASNQQLYLADVVQTVFGESSRKGAVISSAWPDNRWSRTYNQGPDGTYGQGLPGLKVAEHQVAGPQRGVMIGLEESANFRSNLGVVNTSTSETTVSVKYLSRAGMVLGSETLVLPPRGMEQISAPFAVLGGVEDGRVELSSDHGVVVYASVVDNATGDASTVLSKRLLD